MRTTFLPLGILLAVLGAAALAGAATMKLGEYDCSPGRDHFRILSCDQTTCQLLYIYPSGSSKGSVNRSWLTKTIAGAYPNGKPCRQIGAAGGHASGGNAAGAPHGGANAAVAATPKPVARGGGNGSGIIVARYECYTYSGGRLESAMSENFTILGGGRYTDASGAGGTYAFDGATITFRGAALNGMRGKYVPGKQPYKNNPPNVTFIGARGSGDSCDAKVR
jgi:hypothetical protein